MLLRQRERRAIVRRMRRRRRISRRRLRPIAVGRTWGQRVDDEGGRARNLVRLARRGRQLWPAALLLLQGRWMKVGSAQAKVGEKAQQEQRQDTYWQVDALVLARHGDAAPARSRGLAREVRSLARRAGAQDLEDAERPSARC